MKTFPIGLKKKQKKDEWKWIGRITYGNKEGDIPLWILREIDQVRDDPKTPGSSLGGRRYYVNGKSFNYQIAFSGQGGPVVDILRKPRGYGGYKVK